MNISDVCTDYSRTMTISCWSSKASWRLSNFGWCSWFMIFISLLTVFLSSGYGVLINLATKLRPVDFSTARWTTPNAPLHVQSQPVGYTDFGISQQNLAHCWHNVQNVITTLFKSVAMYQHYTAPRLTLQCKGSSSSIPKINQTLGVNKRHGRTLNS